MEENLRVASWRSPSGNWDLAGVQGIPPNQVLHKIQNMIAPNVGRGEDRVAWKLSADGEFSNLSAYLSVLDPSLWHHDGCYKRIWSFQGPKRVRLHLWKMTQGALVTNSWRKRRSLCEVDVCPICSEEEESIMHMTRDCNFMKQVWIKLAEGCIPIRDFFNMDIHGWISQNLKEKSLRRGFRWTLLFGTSVMIAWHSRNEVVFQNMRLTVDVMVNRILGQAYATCQSLQDHLSTAALVTNVPRGRELQWVTPEEGWIKLNCDGAVTSHGAIAGCGGVMRDDRGRFISGFASGLGAATITEAELKAILMGLQHSKNRGSGRIQVETDSMAAVRLIRGECSTLHPCYNLVSNIKDLMGVEGHITLTHTYCEANQVADCFAKHGLGLMANCILFDCVPSFVSIAMLADNAGVVFPRGY